MEKPPRPDDARKGATEPFRDDPGAARVLIADDSPSVRAYLAHIMECAGLTVAGFACDGEEAVRQAAALAPSVITMDIDMPGLDGLTATKRIMEIAPAPIVIVSAQYDKSQMRRTFAALEAGALAIIEKPSGGSAKECTDAARELGRMVALMAKVHVSRRPGRAAKVHESETAAARGEACARQAISLAAIGSSTGGPQSLRTILADLDPQTGFPIVVVQHMTPGFLPGLVDWLASACPLPVSVASAGEQALPGHVYFAPDGLHLEVDAALRLQLFEETKGRGLIPSVARLFASAAKARGKEVLAVLLSGMGADGAREFKLLSDLGACAVVQSEESCAVFGMPGAALRLGAKALALPPKDIAGLINALPRPGKGPRQ
ncbi:MAG: response regulator [Desulfovibrionaceae bacterium]|nr:response regulator [Desulfovibrionaceae bacterium]MBF0514615.1 response regulator [Desulfovibrionaceae bacterium]